MSIKLEGNWKRGLAYDVHTLDSTYLGVDEFGHDQWKNTRSEIGELLYQLKYRGGTRNIKAIVQLLDKIKGIESMDYILPIPSTNHLRPVQPVMEVARALGERRNVEVLETALCKRGGGPELKNLSNANDRETLLRDNLYLGGTVSLRDKSVLLLDDVYRSGTTLRVAADILYEQAGVRDVYVLTMTKTRSNQ
ncbi:hypothetical protein B5T_01727 [Alloalcanivorax dieselolei B5]|uniref:ComF family protein n=1 Tax=Alcanivorax dieselolei (strain DSM 16502 / CGMCC 1.3690 / MCCC 1A00001 / B-5) TaxID=930169 RepID=K0CEH6_ALCDB|nr:ComF family protein [Alloalcanivorax dieselolei]AFT70006.1 hypothetical protein B5T_01727 [Alloalcanivorax dieselolei B5]GGK09347.1 hypothetical protein GCM10007426_42000 [Alloalcanivorax dieselolei]